MTFTSLGLSPRIATTAAALGYDAPTPIQEQAIPVVLEGRDLIGLAQTGTGKTAAFALPIIHKLAAEKRKGVRALIVAPTRELAQQIVDSIKKYAEGTGVKSTAIYGGVRMGSQLKRLRDGVDIVVGCPGRLVDHLERKTLDLSHVETLVLDEADHMFDMGFLPDIKRLISYVPKKRQTLLFSATMPKEIRHLAEEVLIDPRSIQVSNGEMASTVSHALFPVTADLKSKLLEKILKQFEVKSTIIFARTKQRAKRLADTLQRNGYKVACLQGNLSQARRQEAIKGFKDGQFDILVATDLAARGIDVQQVTHVINFDIPMTVEGYTHRIGRTGRAAREGEAFTLISREDESRVRLIEKKLGAKIERKKIGDFDYGVEDSRQSASSSREDRPMRSQRSGGFRSQRPERSRSERPFRERSDSRAPRKENFPEEGGPVRAAGSRPFGNRDGSDRKPGEFKPRAERSRNDRAPFSESRGPRSDFKPRGDFKPRAEGDQLRGPRKPWAKDDQRPNDREGGYRSFRNVRSGSEAPRGRERFSRDSARGTERPSFASKPGFVKRDSFQPRQRPDGAQRSEQRTAGPGAGSERRERGAFEKKPNAGFRRDGASGSARPVRKPFRGKPKKSF